MNMPGVRSPCEQRGEARLPVEDRRQGDAFARLLDVKAATLRGKDVQSSAPSPTGQSAARPLAAQRDEDGETTAPCAAEAAAVRPLAVLQRRFVQEGRSDADPSLAAAAGAPAVPTPLPSTASNPAPAPVAAVVLPESITAPRATFDAALDGVPPLVSTAGAEAVTWEASVHEPSGVAIELRASRSGGPEGWTLTVASPTVGAALLAQHAPRLNERLRARALTDTHVRIERDDGEEA